jgi:hypothetical protein
LDALADALERDDECIDDIMSAVGAALQVLGRELLRTNDPADWAGYVLLASRRMTFVRKSSRPPPAADQFTLPLRFLLRTFGGNSFLQSNANAMKKMRVK